MPMGCSGRSGVIGVAPPGMRSPDVGGYHELDSEESRVLEAVAHMKIVDVEVPVPRKVAARVPHNVVVRPHAALPLTWRKFA